MGSPWAAFLAVLVAMAPFAVAADPLSEPVCAEETCVGAGTCVTDVGCVPRNCGPALECRSRLDTGAQCAENATIDGRTCQVLVSGEARSPLQAEAPLVGAVSGPHAMAAIALAEGEVNLQDLPNTWVSPAVEAHVAAPLVDVGYLSVGAYRSDIRGEGAPNPLAQALHGDEHSFEQVLLVVYHDGPFGPRSIAAGVILVDQLPESCFVRSGSGTFEDVTCPRPGDGLP